MKPGRKALVTALDRAVAAACDARRSYLKSRAPGLDRIYIEACREKNRALEALKAFDAREEAL